jgi:hypothetical protein
MNVGKKIKVAKLESLAQCNSQTCFYTRQRKIFECILSHKKFLRPPKISSLREIFVVSHWSDHKNWIVKSCNRATYIC